jgi:hypothetical protein
MLSINHTIYCAGFEVFIAVVMKSIFFWDVTPCDPEDGGDMFLRNVG